MVGNSITKEYFWNIRARDLLYSIDFSTKVFRHCKRQTSKLPFAYLSVDVNRRLLYVKRAAEYTERVLRLTA